MKSEKFFKWVWNVNGLILLLGLIIGAAAIGYNFVAYLLKSDNHVQQQTLNLAEDEKQQEKWKLGYPGKVEGSDFYFIPLESEKLDIEVKADVTVYNNFSGGYKYRPTGSKNILFLLGFLLLFFLWLFFVFIWFLFVFF